MITKRALRKFKSLYEKHFGEILSDEETEGKANNLINLYRAVYGNVEFPVSDKNKKQEK